MDTESMKIKVKYLNRKPTGLYFFRRAIPVELQKLLDKTEFLYSLKTDDLKTAIKRVEYYKNETDIILSDHGAAVELLAKFNLKPIPLNLQPEAEYPLTSGYDTHHSFFIDHLSDRYSYESLPAAAQLALAMLKGDDKIFLSSLIEFSKDKSFYDGNLERGFSIAKEYFPDNLADAHSYEIQERLKLIESPSQATIKTYLKKVEAALNEYLRYKKREDFINPFAGLKLDTKKKRAKKVKTLTPEQLAKARVIASPLNSEATICLGLLLDTGLRISEAAGLRVSDIDLNHAIPHLVIAPNAIRSLKTDQSERLVPLVNDSLKAAKAALEFAKGEYVFDKWIKGKTLSPSAPSSTVKYLLKSLGVTAHYFRHTLNARAKESGITQEIREFLFGWSGEGMVVYYGKPRTLSLLNEALNTILEHEKAL